MLAPNASSFECPFCHHRGDGVVPFEMLSAVKTGGSRQRVFSLLLDAYPSGISMERIAYEIYGHTKGGGPLSAVIILCNRITELRVILAAYGWSIPHRGNGNVYRLVPSPNNLPASTTPVQKQARSSAQ